MILEQAVLPALLGGKLFVQVLMTLRHANAKRCDRCQPPRIVPSQKEHIMTDPHMHQLLAQLAAARHVLIGQIRGQTDTLHGTADFGIDGVIDPRDTRRLLVETFATCAPGRPDPSPPRYRPILPICGGPYPDRNFRSFCSRSLISTSSRQGRRANRRNMKRWRKSRL
jgi:hypothetical protein